MAAIRAGGGRSTANPPQRPGRNQRSAVDDRPLVSISFDDNRQLAQTLGEYDSHLALIEDRLHVDAVVHGNVVSLRGSSADTALGRKVLEALYLRAGKGEQISSGEVDGEIRHARSSAGDSELSDRPQIRTRRRVITARTPMQGNYIQALQDRDLVFGVGPAGTGKTYLAVAYAAACLERGVIDRLILSRPAVEAGERLGFLPGDMRDKVDPYLRPLYDALYDVLPPEKVERDLEAGVIEIAPLAFMRGRTLSHAFVILDEAQNTTCMQMKMFLTRLGEGSKMVITGDPTQIDLPTGQKSGLHEALSVLQGVEEIETIRFTEGDVVRSALVSKIVAAYERAG